MDDARSVMIGDSIVVCQEFGFMYAFQAMPLKLDHKDHESIF